MIYDYRDHRGETEGGRNAMAAVGKQFKCTVDGRDVSRAFYVDTVEGQVLAYRRTDAGGIVQHPVTMRPIVDAYTGVVVLEIDGVRVQ